MATPCGCGRRSRRQPSSKHSADHNGIDSPRVTNRSRFALWLLPAILGLGVGPFFKKLALERGADLWGVVQMAVLAGALGALLYQILHRRSDLACLTRWPAAGHLLLVGVLASGLVAILSVAAMEHTTATVRALFQAVYPVGTALFAWLLLGERLSRSQWLLIGVLMAGLVLLNKGEEGLAFGVGFWLLLATVPMVGLADAWVRGHLDQLNPTIQTTGRYLFAAVLIACTLPWTGLPAAGVWMAPAVAGGVAMAGGILCFYRAMQFAKAGLAAALVASAPIVTLLCEMTFLDASFTPWQWGGMAVLIASGSCLVLTRRTA